MANKDARTDRREIRDLTDDELLDELQRPIACSGRTWREMVREETLFRILKRTK